MDWGQATNWWIVAGVLVAAELATGTFYLLMLALGAVAAALAAHLGSALNGQLVAAALVGGGAVTAWRFKRGGQAAAAAPAGENRDVNLDIGETVIVTAWDADGAANVHYRGASWAVRYVGQGTPQPGAHVIQALDGNRLLVQPRPNSH